MMCTVPKEKFLSNVVNKQRFINMLSLRLEQDGCRVLHATADADVLIVETAIKMAHHYDTVLVGDDTDLLILLCSQAQNIPHRLFFKPEQKLHSK